MQLMICVLREKGESSICLWLERENYLVILSERGNYVFPWMAYLVERTHQQRKLQRGYEEYRRNNEKKG